MGRQALLASARLAAGEGDAEFLEQKLVSARFFVGSVLPEVHGLVGPATSGAEELRAARF